MNTPTLLLVLLFAALVVLAILFYRHQCLLRDRAWMMHEAIRNHDFQFKIPMRSLFFGERALQRTLNDMGSEICLLMAQNEVESWQCLTRILTHEIMNATTPIQCICQTLLSNSAIKGTSYEEGIRAINKTSIGLSAFVSSYRTLTKLQKPKPTPILLFPFVQNITALYPQMEWKIDVSPGVIIKADEDLLRQVFTNLAKNALEAGARHMDICLMHDALRISNDGAPIPLETRREIFVPFFTTKQTGSGIGLALSRQILTMQGMTLNLANYPVAGYNTTFEISTVE